MNGCSDVSLQDSPIYILPDIYRGPGGQVQRAPGSLVVSSAGRGGTEPALMLSRGQDTPRALTEPMVSGLRAPKPAALWGGTTFHPQRPCHHLSHSLPVKGISVTKVQVHLFVRRAAAQGGKKP